MWGSSMGKKIIRKKKRRDLIEDDTVIDLEAQREARRRQLREAAAESRRKRGLPGEEYDYYGYRPEESASAADIADNAEGISAGAPAAEAVQAAESRGRAAKKKKKKMTPARIVVLILALLVVLGIMSSVWKIISLTMEKNEAQDRITELKEEKALLEEEVSQIGTEAYIEEQARTWLKMAKSGEIIYVFDDEDSGQTTDPLP